MRMTDILLLDSVPAINAAFFKYNDLQATFMKGHNQQSPLQGDHLPFLPLLLHKDPL